jgi:hypothetical protein
MSFRPIYGPLGGPGDLALGIAQGEAEAARIASQRPSSPGLAALGTGLGAGFSRGIESALEQQMFQERQAQRLAAQQQMQAARDQAIWDRMDAREQDALLRQQQRDAARLEREQEKRVFDELSQQAVQGEEILNNAFMSGRMSPADAQAYQEMQTDWAAMAGDGFIYMDPDEQQGYILQRNLSLTKMAQKYRPKSLLDKTLQTSIPGKSLNDRWEAEHGYRPFDESASYQYENRAGGSVLKPVDGTTALDRAKAEAELAKAKGDTGTNYLPLEGTPYAGLAPAGSFGEFKGDQFTGKILKAGDQEAMAKKAEEAAAKQRQEEIDDERDIHEEAWRRASAMHPETGEFRPDDQISIEYRRQYNALKKAKLAAEIQFNLDSARQAYDAMKSHVEAGGEIAPEDRLYWEALVEKFEKNTY